MKHVLFLTDFSEAANKALGVATSLTKQLGAELHVLHSMNTSQQYINMSMSSTGDLGMPGVQPDIIMNSIKEQRKFAEDEMAKLAEKLNKDGIEVNTVISEEEVSRDATEYSRKNNIDLIIMGTHGASGFKEAFIGTNAQKMVRSCTKPVLTISNRVKDFKPKRMVYASDFHEEEVNKRIADAKRFADALGVELKLVFVNTPAYFEDTEKSTKRLNQVADQFGIDYKQTTVYNDFTIEDGILAYADLMDADIISITTHGFKGIKKLLNDNITEALVNHSAKPVLSLTADAE